MSTKDELVSLRAENLALQSLVCGLLIALTKSGNTPIAEGAFRVSDLLLETMTMALGDKIPGGQLPKALKALEEMRAIVFSPKGLPGQ